jgi:hypothetical protein
MRENVNIFIVLIISGLSILYGWLLLFKTPEMVSKFAKFAKKITITDWRTLPKEALFNSLAEHPEKHPSVIKSQKISGCMFICMGIITIILILIFTL